MKRILLIMLPFSIISCTNVPTYKVKIFKKSSSHNNITEIMKDIKAVNDTSAFTEAVRTYWGEKFINQKTNEYVHRSSEESVLDEPYSFTVYKFIKNDSTVIDFDSATATHLAIPVINEAREDVEEIFKNVDSINKKPKADIY